MNNAVIASRIKNVCKQRKISISEVLIECELTKSFVYDLEKRNSSPSCDKIYRIAEYLSCSVDYLLGRTDTINASAIDTYVNGDNHGIQAIKNNVNIANINEDNAKELIRIFKSLPKKEQIRLLNVAYDYEEKYQSKNNT